MSSDSRHFLPATQDTAALRTHVDTLRSRGHSWCDPTPRVSDSTRRQNGLKNSTTSLRYTTTNQLLLTGPLTTGDEVVSGSSLHNVSNQQHRSVLRQHLSEPTCSLQPSQVQSQRRGPAPALSTERASRARPEQNARLHSHVERCKVS